MCVSYRELKASGNGVVLDRHEAISEKKDTNNWIKIRKSYLRERFPIPPNKVSKQKLKKRSSDVVCTVPPTSPKNMKNSTMPYHDVEWSKEYGNYDQNGNKKDQATVPTLDCRTEDVPEKVYGNILADIDGQLFHLYKIREELQPYANRLEQKNREMQPQKYNEMTWAEKLRQNMTNNNDKTYKKTTEQRKLEDALACTSGDEGKSRKGLNMALKEMEKKSLEREKKHKRYKRKVASGSKDGKEHCADMDCKMMSNCKQPCNYYSAQNMNKMQEEGKNEQTKKYRETILDTRNYQSKSQTGCKNEAQEKPRNSHQHSRVEPRGETQNYQNYMIKNCYQFPKREREPTQQHKQVEPLADPRNFHQLTKVDPGEQTRKHYNQMENCYKSKQMEEEKIAQHRIGETRDKISNCYNTKQNFYKSSPRLEKLTNKKKVDSSGEAWICQSYKKPISNAEREEQESKVKCRGATQSPRREEAANHHQKRDYSREKIEKNKMPSWCKSTQKQEVQIHEQTKVKPRGETRNCHQQIRVESKAQNCSKSPKRKEEKKVEIRKETQKSHSKIQSYCKSTQQKDKSSHQQGKPVSLECKNNYTTTPKFNESPKMNSGNNMICNNEGELCQLGRNHNNCCCHLYAHAAYPYNTPDNYDPNMCYTDKGPYYRTALPNDIQNQFTNPYDCNFNSNEYYCDYLNNCRENQQVPDEGQYQNDKDRLAKQQKLKVEREEAKLRKIHSRFEQELIEKLCNEERELRNELNKRSIDEINDEIDSLREYKVKSMQKLYKIILQKKQQQMANNSSKEESCDGNDNLKYPTETRHIMETMRILKYEPKRRNDDCIDKIKKAVKQHHKKHGSSKHHKKKNKDQDKKRKKSEKPQENEVQHENRRLECSDYDAKSSKTYRICNDLQASSVYDLGKQKSSCESLQIDCAPFVKFLDDKDNEVNKQKCNFISLEDLNPEENDDQPTIIHKRISYSKSKTSQSSQVESLLNGKCCHVTTSEVRLKKVATSSHCGRKGETTTNSLSKSTKTAKSTACSPRDNESVPPLVPCYPQHTPRSEHLDTSMHFERCVPFMPSSLICEPPASAFDEFNTYAKPSPLNDCPIREELPRLIYSNGKISCQKRTEILRKTRSSHQKRIRQEAEICRDPEQSACHMQLPALPPGRSVVPCANTAPTQTAFNETQMCRQQQETLFPQFKPFLLEDFQRCRAELQNGTAAQQPMTQHTSHTQFTQQPVPPGLECREPAFEKMNVVRVTKSSSCTSVKQYQHLSQEVQESQQRHHYLQQRSPSQYLQQPTQFEYLSQNCTQLQQESTQQQQGTLSREPKAEHLQHHSLFCPTQQQWQQTDQCRKMQITQQPGTHSPRSGYRPQVQKKPEASAVLSDLIDSEDCLIREGHCCQKEKERHPLTAAQTVSYTFEKLTTSPGEPKVTERVKRTLTTPPPSATTTTASSNVLLTYAKQTVEHGTISQQGNSYCLDVQKKDETIFVDEDQRAFSEEKTYESKGKVALQSPPLNCMPQIFQHADTDSDPNSSCYATGLSARSGASTATYYTNAHSNLCTYRSDSDATPRADENQTGCPTPTCSARSNRLPEFEIPKFTGCPCMFKTYLEMVKTIVNNDAEIYGESKPKYRFVD